MIVFEFLKSVHSFSALSSFALSKKSHFMGFECICSIALRLSLVNEKGEANKLDAPNRITLPNTTRTSTRSVEKLYVWRELMVKI